MGVPCTSIGATNLTLVPCSPRVIRIVLMFKLHIAALGHKIAMRSCHYRHLPRLCKSPTTTGLVTSATSNLTCTDLQHRFRANASPVRRVALSDLLPVGISQASPTDQATRSPASPRPSALTQTTGIGSPSGLLFGRNGPFWVVRGRISKNAPWRWARVLGSGLLLCEGEEEEDGVKKRKVGRANIHITHPIDRAKM